ncbi:bifunctional GNAT family N-acetyltransferase/acetate--CoA ligase family protein [Nocardioides panacihumi]|uniref:Bifunctional GNAT family N-acetyltransferase/acetate--CoA ligase family protein n=1 Tax=Nocardioides panacihumi TaxID=400774 RepID=A0ABN2RUI1_9ACTN
MTSPSPPRAADVLLSDGRIASIRPLDGSDRAGLIALHDAVADESIRLRFFTPGRIAAHRYVDHLLSAPEDAVLTLVAVVSEELVGVVSAEILSADAAEVAMLVADREHGHGLGSLLLEHVAAACRNRGIHRFVAEVLADNNAMLQVFRDAGFDTVRHIDRGEVSVEMSTEATARAVEAADARESASEARSLRPLLYPRSVALIGVRRDGSGLGHAVLRSVIDGGFTGKVHVVHPDVPSMEGITTVRRLRDIVDHVDLAIVTVPADQVVAAIDDATAAGVPAAVVISSGFGELGPEGADLQRSILRLARSHGMRLVGPNCMGVTSNDPDIRLNATFTSSVPRPGGLAVASQSGGVGIALLDAARRHGLGVHAFISLGNKADVSGNDLLNAWVDDPSVTAAALYLESFGNARKFARVARRFAARKPLLAVVGGLSASGRRAGASHTAAAATPAVGVEALFAQAGVIRCDSAESMTRTALLLDQQPLPSGRRLGVVSNAGGLGVLAVDSAEAAGLLVPELSGDLRAELATQVSVTVGTSNPVDLGAGATAGHMTRVVDGLLGSDEIDVLLVVLVPTTVATASPLVEALGSLQAQHADKPIVLVGLGDLGEGAGGVTVYHALEHAIDAITHAVQYAEWRRTPPASYAPRDVARTDAVRAVAAKLVDPTQDAARWLPPGEVHDLLDPYGLAPVGLVAEDPDQAARAAAEIGFPVVLKAASPDIVHKTDRGLVRVDLRTASAVTAGARDLAAIVGTEHTAVLVQPMVEGVEVAMGVIRDPGFGPLVMVAAGGIATNILADRTFLLPPVSAQDAARAIRSLRMWPLLDGYRGAPRVDVAALEGMVVSLAELALDVPELSELDLNPVFCQPGGAVAVDAKVALRPASTDDDGVPRRLRDPA